MYDLLMTFPMVVMGLANKDKYSFTGNTYIQNGCIFRQIIALKDFETITERKIKKSDLGGWICSEKNLEQEGRCWVDSEVFVSKDVQVKDDAYLSGDLFIQGKIIFNKQNVVICNGIISG